MSASKWAYSFIFIFFNFINRLTDKILAQKLKILLINIEVTRFIQEYKDSLLVTYYRTYTHFHKACSEKCKALLYVSWGF